MTIEELRTILTQLQTSYSTQMSDSALSTLQKTFRDKNITIQDWNDFVVKATHTNTKLSDYTSKEIAMLAGILDLFNNISDTEFQTTSDPAYTIAQSVKVTKNGQSTYYRFAGGGGGSTYTSGNGIVVDNTNHTIAIDDQVAATKTDLTSKQDKSNLVSSWQETTDDTHYPSEKLVKDSIATETQNRQTADTLITGSVNQINAKIPSQASALNQLADKSFVNSSIATNTANFLGTLDVVSDLGLQYGATHSAVVNALNQHTFSQEKTNNDYCFVINKDNNNNVIYERYKYATNTFAYEYTLNNSSFTASQWNSINSGITSGKVATYDAYETSKQDTIDSQHKLSADLVDDTNSSNKFSQFYIHNAGTGITWQRISEIINSGKLLYLNYAGVLYQYFNGSNIDCYFGSLDMANGGYKLRLITYHPYQGSWEYDEKNIYPTIRNEAPSTSSGNLKEFWFDTTDNSLYLCTSTTGGVRTWTKVSGSSGGGTWGSITGTLSDQTDLKNALDLKQDCIFIDFGD